MPTPSKKQTVPVHTGNPNNYYPVEKLLRSLVKNIGT
jgi:hypothetical protein